MSKKPTIKELEQKVGELTDALQRERADAQNLRRRTDEERAKMAEFYKAMVIQELLPALDNLERAMKHVPKDLADHDYVKGTQGVIKQFEQSFSQLGVKRIKTVGEVFDPRLHEAVHMEDGDGSVEVVCEELQPGYLIGDEVIRHAMVKVKMEKIKE
ncbi:nucleotide exchange factor GrpE [Candidatus Saccharibacteria bacterium]|nr:nucleotide exchange factor GrpE [Candidatus Saccharibacteria bacterium]